MLKLKVLIKPDGSLEASGELLGKISNAGANGTKLCRSPVAQGVFEEIVRREGLAGEVEADSAGTHGYYHAGEPPDPRARRSAAKRGIDISSQRARRLTPEDCQKFDYILFMDEENGRLIKPLCKSGEAEARLLLNYAPGRPEQEVPDPYHGGPGGFELVMDLVEEASEGLLADVRRRHLKDDERAP
jgi:protein-tyrosine phosphatase